MTTRASQLAGQPLCTRGRFSKNLRLRACQQGSEAGGLPYEDNRNSELRLTLPLSFSLPCAPPFNLQPSTSPSDSPSLDLPFSFSRPRPPPLILPPSRSPIQSPTLDLPLSFSLPRAPPLILPL
ncbi:unnamed protein product [Closterium sp. Naga37s-1]|nr:unnamed protein product [Closterium sp. Naga37s-1]